MGYGNERMPWHPRKAAKTASIEWKDAGYGNLAIVALLLSMTVCAEAYRHLVRRLTGSRNERNSR